MAFYPATGETANALPVVTRRAAVRDLFGRPPTVSAALVRTPRRRRPGSCSPRSCRVRTSAPRLVATSIAANVRRMFEANTAFFQLMQGFLALGLLVGITGLGVVMVRAVRERRRTIGVLRALGFRVADRRRGRSCWRAA